MSHEFHPMLKKGFVRWGIILGSLALLIRALAGPEWIERYYSRGFFQLFRMFWDTILSSWFPVALLYLLALILLVRFARAIYQWWRLRGIKRLWSLLAGVLGFAGWLIFTFLVIWGYNYGRISVEEKLGLSLQPPAWEVLQAQIEREAEILSQLRSSIPESTDAALDATYFPEDMEGQLRDALEEVLSYYNYPVVGSVRARVLYPKGIFLRFSSAGLYLPWTAEGHVDAGLLHVQRPYIMAHELAHGYGFGDEGTCSFWGYLTAFRVTDPSLHYAIRLGYWRSLAARWLRFDPDGYQRFREQLPAGIVADLEAINANNASYPDIMPRFRDAAYDSYLKAQGIAEGMQNYGKVILMVEAWRPDAGPFIENEFQIRAE